MALAITRPLVHQAEEPAAQEKNNFFYERIVKFYVWRPLLSNPHGLLVSYVEELTDLRWLRR